MKLKKLLSVILSLVLASGLLLNVGAASLELVGTTDFVQYMSGDGKVMNRTVKSRSKNYRVTGIYYEDESKAELNYVNKARKEAGLPALKWDSRLESAAIQRAFELYIAFSHTRPDGSGWRTVDEYVNGENLAKGENTYFGANTVTDGWLNSPGHHDNIMANNDVSKYFVSMAVACVETDSGVFWAQLFHADPKTAGADWEDSEEPYNSGNERASSATVTAKSIAADLDKIKTNKANASLTLKAVNTLPLDVIKAAANWGTKNNKTVSLTATTLTSTGKSTQGRVTMNPAGFTKNKNAVKTGVYVEKSAVKGVEAGLAKKHPGTKFEIIKLTQGGNYGGMVTVGAKANLSGLNTKSLLFYTYNQKTGKLERLNLGKSGYSIDKNKYLNFKTSKGGYIVVTDTAF